MIEGQQISLKLGKAAVGHCLADRSAAVCSGPMRSLQAQKYGLISVREPFKIRYRLRHPTIQRIFGRAEVSLWGWTSAAIPLYAISGSN